MFTGIVEELGRVRHCRRNGNGYDLSIECQEVLKGTALGDSIAVNGVCLTVTEMDNHGFISGLAPETRKRTNLESLSAGSMVNLERSVTPTTRMGGHFVQGHVDATGEIREFRRDEDALWVSIGAAESLMRYVVVKGYITLDGTSLTVVDVGRDWFSVTLVAYTQAHIIMPSKRVGDTINIEVDVLGKYVERLLQTSEQQYNTDPENKRSPISAEFLKENGYE
ncbi:MAG: riboflavin synthase [Granulosicoccus sp.]|nr:riboflavin synthase [Granulosicoccus sp.]